jgi:hypothetical protein
MAMTLPVRAPSLIMGTAHGIGLRLHALAALRSWAVSVNEWSTAARRPDSFAETSFSLASMAGQASEKLQTQVR